MLAVDHRFALSNPALVSAPSKQNRSPTYQLPDLGMQRLPMDRWRGRRSAARPKN
jgi:hypothetical protein